MYEININSNKPKRFYLYILIALVSFGVGWQAKSFGLFDGSVAKIDTQNEILNRDEVIGGEVDMSLFWTVWKELDKKYIHEEALEDENMVYGAIKGMVNALNDPYTAFMTPEESKEFIDSLEGTLEGIGAELTVKDKQLVIVTPLKKSPAEKSGLKAGDVIDKINGESAGEMSLLDAITRIRGKKGTTVTLTILREKIIKPFDVSIVRDSIDIESVTVEKLDDGIVYMSVNQFNEKTKEEFGRAISELILAEPKGLILDFRYNGGGYLDTAVELLSYVLPKDTKLVILKERGKEDEVKYANGNPKLLNVPMVILVNESSASASEIVAGAIQDQKRGIVMGTKTFGKGSVQEVKDFEGGSSMRLTIAKWFTPNGTSIDKIGLMPDIVVEMSEADIKKQIDTQKEAAVKYLKELK
ncbi:MAG: S41 family peptidase [Patescibacteria group bacterium]